MKKSIFILLFILSAALSSAQNKSDNELFSGQQTKQDKNHFLIKDSNIVKRNQDSTKNKINDDTFDKFSVGVGFSTYDFLKIYALSLKFIQHFTQGIYFLGGINFYKTNLNRVNVIPFNSYLLSMGYLHRFKSLRLDGFLGAGLLLYDNTYFVPTAVLRLDFQASKRIFIGCEVDIKVPGEYYLIYIYPEITFPVSYSF